MHLQLDRRNLCFRERKILLNYFHDANIIHGRFNYHLKNCLLLHSEEAVFGGDKKHRAIIKDYIANKSGEYEEKYMGIVHGKAYGRLIYTSNEVRAAPLELGDTRHTVFNFNSTGRIPPAALVQAVYYEGISDGPAALMHFLLNYEPYNGALMGSALHTLEKELTLYQNMDALDVYWLTKLKEGELLEKRLRWAQGSARSGGSGDDTVTWPKVVSRTTLYADYLQTSGEIKATAVSAHKFAQRLSEWIGTKIVFKLVTYFNDCAAKGDGPRLFRELYSGQHQAISNLPPLDKCRKAFEKYAGQRFQWDEVTLESDDDETTELMLRDARQARF